MSFSMWDITNHLAAGNKKPEAEQELELIDFKNYSFDEKNTNTPPPSSSFMSNPSSSSSNSSSSSSQTTTTAPTLPKTDTKTVNESKTISKHFKTVLAEGGFRFSGEERERTFNNSDTHTTLLFNLIDNGLIPDSILDKMQQIYKDSICEHIRKEDNEKTILNAWSESHPLGKLLRNSRKQLPPMSQSPSSVLLESQTSSDKQDIVPWILEFLSTGSGHFTANNNAVYQVLLFLQRLLKEKAATTQAILMVLSHQNFSCKEIYKYYKDETITIYLTLLEQLLPQASPGNKGYIFYLLKGEKGENSADEIGYTFYSSNFLLSDFVSDSSKVVAQYVKLLKELAQGEGIPSKEFIEAGLSKLLYVASNTQSNEVMIPLLELLAILRPQVGDTAIERCFSKSWYDPVFFNGLGVSHTNAFGSIFNRLVPRNNMGELIYHFFKFDLLPKSSFPAFKAAVLAFLETLPNTSPEKYQIFKDIQNKETRWGKLFQTATWFFSDFFSNSNFEKATVILAQLKEIHEPSKTSSISEALIQNSLFYSQPITTQNPQTAPTPGVDDSSELGIYMLP